MPALSGQLVDGKQDTVYSLVDPAFLHLVSLHLVFPAPPFPKPSPFSEGRLQPRETGGGRAQSRGMRQSTVSRVIRASRSRCGQEEGPLTEAPHFPLAALPLSPRPSTTEGAPASVRAQPHE